MFSLRPTYYIQDYYSFLGSGNKTKAFDENEQVESDVVEQEPDFDWISVAKKRKLEALEDNKALFSRLKKVN